MTLSKKQIAEVLFTPTEDGKAKCTICGRSYAPGNGYTNRLSHARTHERYEEVAEEMFVAQEAQRTEDGEPTTSGNSSPSTSTATTAATTTATASGSTTVTSTTGSSATASTTTPAASGPRPRGRPPGSKNKSTLAAAQQQPVESKKRKYEHKENGESASASEDAQVGGSTLPAKLQIAALRKELQAFQTSVLASFQTMRSDVVALKDEVESMRSSINQLTNSDRRVKNRRIADRGDQEVPLHRLIRLNKSLGGGISGGQMFQPPAVAVGEEFPTPPFPKNLAEIDGMQRQQIHELAVLMDNDFGIVSGDNLAMCRTKVHRVLADHD